MSLKKSFFVFTQRLAGATLLVFANKQDLPGALSAEEIRDVSILTYRSYYFFDIVLVRMSILFQLVSIEDYSVSF